MLKISGISEKGICRIIDDKRTYEEVEFLKFYRKMLF